MSSGYVPLSASELVFWSQAVSLEGKYVKLVPYVEDHAAGILEAHLTDPNMFLLFPPSDSVSYKTAEDVIAHHKRNMSYGEVFFTLFSKENDKIVGVYSFFNIETANRALEIGVWLASNCRGTKINLETVYLLLCHAFDTCKAFRVSWKTDSRNIPSQKAALKAGAVQEGIIRSHCIMKDGHRRDSLLYSWLDTEFEALRKILHEKLYSSS